MAGNPGDEPDLRFNIRLATPPPGADAPAGCGSTYLFGLKAGDMVTAIGPFGQFHVSETEREKVYLGGGSGMAPLRSHLAYLFETCGTAASVSFWFGARSRQDLFYLDYFEDLNQKVPNFSFHAALSEPRPEDKWQGRIGLIHEVLRREYLAGHPNPQSIEYFLCGPPGMIKAATSMLKDLEVDPKQIFFDEF